MNGQEMMANIAIGDEAGKVVMAFDRPMSRLVLDPENARQIALWIAKASYVARYGKEPPAGNPLAQEIRSKATTLMRQKLTNRAAIVMRSLYEQRWTPARAAREIVDIMMKELT